MSQPEFNSVLPNGVGLAPYLRTKQEGMTKSKSHIVEWLLEPGNLSCASTIKDVAEVLMVSKAMIAKVLKPLGFSGLRNLRSALEDYFSQSEQVLPPELAFDEAPQDAVNKVLNITLHTIMKGQPIANVDGTHCTARFFYQARQQDLYGVGGLNTIYTDIQYKLLCIGVCCQAHPGAHAMIMSASLPQEGDTALIVTHSGRTSDIETAVELAKRNGAKIVCITRNYRSPIAKPVSYIVYSPAPGTPLLSRSASARIL